MKLADLGKPLRVLFTGSSFVFFWSGGALLSLVVLPLESRRSAPPEVKRRRSRGWVQWGFRVFHGYMRLWGLTDYEPRRVRLELPEGPCVLICNHPTLVDVTAILSVVDDTAVVVKGDWWLPMIKPLLELCGHIHGGDGGAMAAGSVAVQALECLEQGQRVLIFPEGTRSPEGGLHPFQRGAFEIARRGQVPLVPLMITADPPWLMKHQRWYQVPGRMNRMRLYALDEAAARVPTERSRELARRFEDSYREALSAWLHKQSGSGMVRGRRATGEADGE